MVEQILSGRFCPLAAPFPFRRLTCLHALLICTVANCTERKECS